LSPPWTRGCIKYRYSGAPYLDNFDPERCQRERWFVKNYQGDWHIRSIRERRSDAQHLPSRCNFQPISFITDLRVRENLPGLRLSVHGRISQRQLRCVPIHALVVYILGREIELHCSTRTNLSLPPRLLITSQQRGPHPALTGNLPGVRCVTFTSSEMHVDGLCAASNLERFQLYWIISEIGIRESSEIPSDLKPAIYITCNGNMSSLNVNHDCAPHSATNAMQAKPVYTSICGVLRTR